MEKNRESSRPSSLAIFSTSAPQSTSFPGSLLIPHPGVILEPGTGENCYEMRQLQ